MHSPLLENNKSSRLDQRCTQKKFLGTKIELSAPFQLKAKLRRFTYLLCSNYRAKAP